MRRADADVYYQNCAESTTGRVALWAHRHGRRFVYSVASDPECDPSLPILESLHERVLYRKGLELADGIITQTSVQQRMLKEGFGLESTPIPMPSDIHVDGSFDHIDAKRESTFSVLWVGRMMPVKRPEIFLQLAKSLPDVDFHLVEGVDQDAAYNEGIFKQAVGISNLTVHGRKPREEVLELYRRSHVLCCTSSLEGFPNTFLEAFAHGMPVVSTVDPDAVLERHQLGAHRDSVDTLVSTLREFSVNRERVRRCGQTAWQYFYDQHALDTAMPRFESFREHQASRS